MIMPARLVLALALVAALALPAAAAEPPAPEAAPRAKVVSLSNAVPPPAASTGEVVSLRLARAVPGRVLEVGLNKTVQLAPLPAEARDIIVGSSEIADVIVRSPTEVFVVGRGIGQTNIQFRDARGRTIARIEVDVHVDIVALKLALNQVLPDETGLRVSAVDDSIYLSGTVGNDADAATVRALARRFVKDDSSLVNLVRVNNEQQVMLRVKVAEIQKSALKELGFSDSLTAAHGLPAPLRNALSTGTSTLATGTGSLTSAAGTAFATSSNALTGTPYGVLNLTGIGPLATTFSMLESQDLLRTLEEPNLTAVSGQTATMLAGGEFPIPVSETNGQIAIDFKKFGVGLSFTPVVLDPGRISLKLQTEVSSVDKTFSVSASGLTVYGLKVRRAGSVVEMPSGGSIMIAGLLQNDISSATAGLPGLMDVPVLGQLFRSNSFQHNESELVVIVSAYIVQPVSSNQLMTGADGFAPSSDLSRFLWNRLQDVYVKSRATPEVPAQLQGPFGYAVQ